MENLTGNSAEVIERKINLEKEPKATETNLLENVYEISRCSQWIQGNNFQKVSLYFSLEKFFYILFQFNKKNIEF